MLNITKSLEHRNINPQSYLQAVQQVREQIEGDECAKAGMLLFSVFDLDVKFDDARYALIVSQRMVENAIKNDCIIEDAAVALENAQLYAHEFINRPANKWMFAISAHVAASTITEVREVGGTEQVVAVNADGKFKKGEKQRLGRELYQKWIAGGADPKNNQEFIAILMKELDMSKSGATTYNYNLKKEFGQEIAVKNRRV